MFLEYDNDNDNPDTPHRSAHESAIFAHLRRTVGTRAPVVSHRNNHDATSTLAGNSTLDKVRSRASRGSIDALRNPFGADDSLLEYENEGEEDELEVDLASWGLDAFMPKDKLSRTGKGKAKSTDLTTPHHISSVPSHQPMANTVATAPRRVLGASRSMSVGGNMEYFGIEGVVRNRHSSLQMDTRRRSVGSQLDFSGMDSTQIPLQRRRATSHTLIRTPAIPHAIPFPTSTNTPLHANEDVNGSRPLSLPHERVLSTATVDSKAIVQEADRRSRTNSNTTMLLADDNPFALRPPSRGSRFDPKAVAHARTISNASMGSRMLLENDGVSTVDPAQLERDRRYSTTLDLLRPKVLVMPSPLQSAPVPPRPLNDTIRDGFLLSTDGPPLPPGARSARRSSITLSAADANPPVPSNSFIPNPLASLSLSQMTFRDTLLTGGQRDSAYTDRLLPRATEDGEQVNIDMTVPEEEEEEHIPPSPGLYDPSKPHRPAGKLYGKSLIDDLEGRKAQMRNKQRYVSCSLNAHEILKVTSVFTGDERPSMMARGPQRSSTLIDPAALQKRPTLPPLPRTSSYEPQTPQALARRNSANAKPLLNFDDDKMPRSNLSPANARSVFGVDTLWEREMVKLREIEAREKVEAEERRKREAEEKKKGKRRKKQKQKANATPEANSPPLSETEKSRVSVEPPILPNIQRAVRRPPQVPDDESESDESEDAGPSRIAAVGTSWYAGSSDEDGGPRRTTGTGPRYPDKQRRRSSEPVDVNSEDDLPLSVALNRAAQRATLSHPADSDDEEKPLSVLLQKKQLNLSEVSFDNALNSHSGQNDDDDDQPLGLRISRFGGQGDPGADDDERPLAFHPEQQRKTQYQMIAQQQQQQMMLQAQMQSNMFFSGPSMMGPQFFAPPMMPMMVQHPMQAPPLPTVHDDVKFGRVDKWRHDVAVEGDA